MSLRKLQWLHFPVKANDRNQRTTATNQAGEYWAYGYDSDAAAARYPGQVTAATKSLGNGTAIPGYSFAYSYDSLGNRLSAQAGK